MRILKYLTSAVFAITLLACEGPEQPPKKQYPILEDIVGTLWYSVDTKNQIYYDINYAETTGTMVGYNGSQREEIVSNRNFTYSFVPANNDTDAIVSIAFEDGQLYSGILIPKGHFQINSDEVYWIQLYEVNDKGFVIYDDNGKIKSSILMWKE